MEVPIYQPKHVCRKCGQEFDMFQKIREVTTKGYLECGGKIERCITLGSGFNLKGL